MAVPKAFSSMPGPKGLPAIGSVLNYSKFGKHSFDRLYLAKKDYFLQYGKIYKESLGPATIVNLFDPVDIAKVFRQEGKYPNRPTFGITMVAHKRDGLDLGLGSLSGEDWYNLRKSVQKLMMHPRAASVYLPAQSQVADDFLNIMEQKYDAKSGQIPDCYKEILKYTMESIGTVCFNTRIGCLATDLGSDASDMMAASADMFEAVQKTLYAFPWFNFFPTPIYKQFIRGKRSCGRIAGKYIQDTLHRIETDADNIDESVDPNFLSNILTTEGLSKRQAVDITIDLFTAGIDSTANALSFVLYNLAKNPEKQQKLFMDLDRVLPSGTPVTSAAIDKLSYLKACVKESFRLNFPVEGGTNRILEEDTVLGGYLVPKGTFISMNNQTMCYQEEYFESPRDYLPERWVKDERGDLRAPPPYVMMPFGHGPRMCIGRRFAEQEIYLALIKIVRRFKVEYHYDEIGMLNRIFTMPDKPLRLTFIPRN